MSHFLSRALMLVLLLQLTNALARNHAQATATAPDSLSNQKQTAARRDTVQRGAPSPPDSTGLWLFIKQNKEPISSVVAIIAVLATIIGLIMNRKTRAREKLFTRDKKREESLAEREVKAEFAQLDNATLRERYLDFVRREHGHLKLLGFISRSANLNVRLIEVFVALRFSATGREFEMKRGALMEEREENERGHSSPKEVLQRARRKKSALLILGQPGSGKTTLLKFYAMCCLDAEGRKQLELEKPLIPLLVPLRQLVEFEAAASFAHAVSAWAKKHEQNLAPEQIETWLRSPGGLVLLDGLDEISDLSKRRAMCERIDSAIASYGASTFVLTCRFTGYREAEGVTLYQPHVQAAVRDFNAAQQEAFLKQWFRAAEMESAEESELQNSARLQALERAGRQKAEALLAFLLKEENRSLLKLAETPVLLQIMAILWKEGEGNLAGERVALYNRSIEFLLDLRDRAKKIEPLMSADKARVVLRPLALWMQQERKDEAPASEIEQRIAVKLQEVRPDKTPSEFLEYYRDRAGVLVGAGAETFTFQHKSLREFLAAHEIAIQQKPDALVENFGEDWWRETILFSAGLTGPEIFPKFIRGFLKHEKNNGPTSPLLLQAVREAAVAPLEPFAQALNDQRLVWQKRYNTLQCVRLLGAAKAGAKELVKAALKDKQAQIRELAEGILHEWDEAVPSTSVAVRGNRLFNPFELQAEYILLPGGKYKYSATRQEVVVPDMYFAKYPVTNKRYRRFIAFLNGKAEEPLLRLSREQFAESLLLKAKETEGFVKYLGKDPAQWAKKLRSNYDDDKRFNDDEQPVVGVSWFAAVAYTHWLNELQRSTINDQQATRVFKLPTEEEWEWAASGGARKYPWGTTPEPNDKLANYGGKVGQTTPVGSYPDGATPEGLMDMAGNVWEWSEDLFGEGTVWGKEARALRGGSWHFTTGYLRCVARNYVVPGSYWFSVGFRVACASSPIF